MSKFEIWLFNQNFGHLKVCKQSGNTELRLNIELEPDMSFSYSTEFSCLCGILWPTVMKQNLIVLLHKNWVMMARLLLFFKSSRTDLLIFTDFLLFSRTSSFVFLSLCFVFWYLFFQDQVGFGWQEVFCFERSRVV